MRRPGPQPKSIRYHQCKQNRGGSTTAAEKPAMLITSAGVGFTEDALFDAETLFDTMIPKHKLETPYIGQGNTQPFNKLIRDHKLAENVHKNFAEKFL